MKYRGPRKAVALKALLEDDAAIWYQSLNRSYGWEDFKKEFLHRFSDAQAEDNARIRLHQLKQTGSAKKFTEEFKRVAACIPDLTESDKFNTYRHGLRADLRHDLLVMKVKTFDEAVREAEELDEIQFQERRASADGGKKPKTEKVRKVTEKLRDRKPKDSAGDKPKSESKRAEPKKSEAGEKKTPSGDKAKEQEELRRKGACFYCKQLGHIAIACPSKASNAKAKN